MVIEPIGEYSFSKLEQMLAFRLILPSKNKLIKKVIVAIFRVDFLNIAVNIFNPFL